MATPLYDPKLSGSKFKNWIKAGLGILFAKEGIEHFVYDEIEQFQQKCLSDICNNNGLPAGTTCSSCCTENVVVCPTNRICNARRGKCNFHRNSATQYLQSGCLSKICHNFKSQIQRAHRFYCPSFRNTDATQWCSNPWEVAKCFMPPDGYKDVTNATETDFNGIISVIMNFEAFQSKIHDDLSKPYNIFEEGREVGKAVRHSPSLEVEDTDLQQYFSILQNLLSDPAYLSARTDAQNAKTKLLQLQNDSLFIGKDDVKKVLDDVAEEVQDKIRTAKDGHNKEAEKKKMKLIKITKESIRAIGKHGSVSVAQLDRAFKSANVELEKQTMELLKKADIAKKQLGELADKGVNKLEVESEAGVTKIMAKAAEALKQIEESRTANNEHQYKKFKRDHEHVQLRDNYRSLTNRQQHQISSILSSSDSTSEKPSTINKAEYGASLVSATLESNDITPKNDDAYVVNSQQNHVLSQFNSDNRSPAASFGSVFHNSVINGGTFNINVNLPNSSHENT